MYTLEDIADLHEYEMVTGQTDVECVHQYIREEYVPCYDEQFEFVGYERA